jgi:hypothetical protein
MTDEGKFMSVYLDLLPNQPKNDQTRQAFREMLWRRFDERLPDSVERIWELPPIILKEPLGNYLTLLLEARDLFVSGHFYSCVAMCGIVGERLVKDVLRTRVLVQADGGPRRPTDSAFDQFERVEVSGIVRFLKEAGLLSPEAARSADDLGQLRNRYTHARGEDARGDALKAIRLLHSLVEATVSVFKEYEIKDGAFVPKQTSPPRGV